MGTGGRAPGEPPAPRHTTCLAAPRLAAPARTTPLPRQPHASISHPAHTGCLSSRGFAAPPGAAPLPCSSSPCDTISHSTTPSPRHARDPLRSPSCRHGLGRQITRHLPCLAASSGVAPSGSRRLVPRIHRTLRRCADKPAYEQAGPVGGPSVHRPQQSRAVPRQLAHHHLFAAPRFIASRAPGLPASTSPGPVSLQLHAPPP